ncbi:MAG TPA: choice-of-anchor tandem repeat GloVer-containing protein [Bacteroidia bacterium]|jgi:uncharacterized repeat protein (TIGR03803 family)|nr:choice-of-anchor tandem repeat GloVer-containing protein [Bacteroidia bacterium]
MKKNLLVIILVCCISDFASAQYKKLHDFSIGNGDGEGPHGSLIILDNKLYGTTVNGGKYSNGIIYSIDTNGSGYTIIHNFNDTDGAGPFYSTLTLSGNTLFGTASIGGTGGDGVIYCIQTNGNGYKVLFNFNGTNGNAPEGKLSLCGNRLYGTTNEGGAYNYGIIFSIDTNGSGYKVLLNFNDTNGSGPFGTELLRLGDKLYSTVGGGGKYKYGIVFSIDTNGNGYTDLFDFGATSASGGSPNGSLTFLGGMLYGMTEAGGTGGVGGTLFSIDTNGNKFHVLYNVTNGGDSYCSVACSNGILYSMTQGGPLTYGYIFAVDTGGTTIKDIFDFHDTDGYSPVECGLTLWGGMIYGVTESGGLNNDGVIFSYKDSAVTTSVNQLSVNGHQLSVYPNPGNGVANYELRITNYEGTYQMNVFNIFGECIYSEWLNSSKGQIDLSTQSAGIYLYRVTSEKGELVGSGKLIIQ